MNEVLCRLFGHVRWKTEPSGRMEQRIGGLDFSAGPVGRITHLQCWRCKALLPVESCTSNVVGREP